MRHVGTTSLRRADPTLMAAATLARVSARSGWLPRRPRPRHISRRSRCGGKASGNIISRGRPRRPDDKSDDESATFSYSLQWFAFARVLSLSLFFSLADLSREIIVDSSDTASNPLPLPSFASEDPRAKLRIRKTTVRLKFPGAEGIRGAPTTGNAAIALATSRKDPSIFIPLLDSSLDRTPATRPRSRSDFSRQREREREQVSLSAVISEDGVCRMKFRRVPSRVSEGGKRGCRRYSLPSLPLLPAERASWRVGGRNETLRRGRHKSIMP